MLDWTDKTIDDFDLESENITSTLSCQYRMLVVQNRIQTLNRFCACTRKRAREIISNPQLRPASINTLQQHKTYYLAMQLNAHAHTVVEPHKSTIIPTRLCHQKNRCAIHQRHGHLLDANRECTQDNNDLNYSLCTVIQRR